MQWIDKFGSEHRVVCDVWNRNNSMWEDITDTLVYKDGGATIEELEDHLMSWLYSTGEFANQVWLAPVDKDVEIDGRVLCAEDMSEAELQDIASALYDGGWRYEDEQGISREYQIDGWNLYMVRRYLKQYMEDGSGRTTK